MADEKKIAGYKVKNLWSVVPGKVSSTSHKIGDILAVKDIETKKGLDRDVHIAELVRIGCLEPVYEQEAHVRGPHSTGPLHEAPEG